MSNQKRGGLSRLGKNARQIFQPADSSNQTTSKATPINNGGNSYHPAVWCADMIYLQTKLVCRFWCPSITD